MNEDYSLVFSVANTLIFIGIIGPFLTIFDLSLGGGLGLIILGVMIHVYCLISNGSNSESRKKQRYNSLLRYDLNLDKEKLDYYFGKGDEGIKELTYHIMNRTYGNKYDPGKNWLSITRSYFFEFDKKTQDKVDEYAKQYKAELKEKYEQELRDAGIIINR